MASRHIGDILDGSDAAVSARAITPGRRDTARDLDEVRAIPPGIAAPPPPPTITEYDGTNFSASGSAEAGATVRLFAGVTLLGETVAAADGSWTVDFAPLAPSPSSYTLIAEAENADGVTATDQALGISIFVEEDGGQTIRATSNAALDERLIGGAANDTVDGGEGEDTLAGGAGSDAFIVNSAGDLIIEAAGGGDFDRVETGLASYTLTDNVENLIGISAFGVPDVDQALTGNALDNVVRAKSGDFDDTLTGGAGDDTLLGFGGTDVAVFSGDRDDYSIVVDGDDFILTDTRGGSPDGTDEVSGDIETYRFADGDVAAGDLIAPPDAPVIDSISFDGGGAVQGSADADVIISLLVDGVEVASTDEVLDGGFRLLLPSLAQGAHVVTAIASNLSGDSDPSNSIGVTRSGDDYAIDGSVVGEDLSGGDGDDTLDGNGGRDELSGGAGDDTIEGGAESGIDRDIASFSGARADYRITAEGDGFRVVDLRDPNDEDVDDFSGSDLVSGVGYFRFDDAVVRVERILGGDAGPDAPVLERFDYGARTVSGTAEVGSTVSLYFDEPGGELIGTDTVGADGAWSIAFPALDPAEYSFQAEATDAEGVSGASTQIDVNVRADGVDITAPAGPGGDGAEDEILVGGDGDDNINGGTGQNTLFGGAGNDTFGNNDSGANFFGSATMIGGEGDDLYVTGIADIIEEADGGFDSARIDGGVVIWDNVEELVARGNGVIVGNDSDNVIRFVDDGANEFTGSTVTGGIGDDTLQGRAGAGRETAVYSGSRDDYDVAAITDGFVIADTRGGSPDGTDTVTNFQFFEFADGLVAAADLLGDVGQPATPVFEAYDYDTDTLVGITDANVTVMLYNGAALVETTTSNANGRFSFAGITPSGQNANVYTAIAENADGPSARSDSITVDIDQFDAVTIRGGAGDEALSGTTDVDDIFGADGDDTLTSDDADLYGGEGNDSLTGDGLELDGGAGDDTMTGGTSDNDYVVDSEGDVIVEVAGGGDGDEVETTLARYALGDNLENLQGSGDGTQILTGNAADNDIDASFGGGGDNLVGLDGDDSLRGQEGDDTLEGGAGDDELIGEEDFGNADVDVAVFSGNRADYSIVEYETQGFGTGLEVTDLRAGSPDGVDLLAQIEILRFADGDVAVGDPPNNMPVASDDSVTTDEDMAVTIAVLGNDDDADGDVLTVTAATAPANGTVAVNPDGTITYTPDADFSGTDSFDYTISDGNGGSDTANVTITVNEVVDPPGNLDPVARNDAATTDEDQSITIAVLGNDTDADGDALTVTAATAPDNGAVAVNADGTITYTPDADFSGTDSFDYTISDGNGGSDTASVTVTVNEVVDPPGNADPVARQDEATTSENDAVVIAVLANDSDADGDVLTVTAVDAPGNGTAVINADGTIGYTPDAGFVGVDEFRYTVSDGAGGSDTGRVTITVTEDVDPPGNSPPVAADDAASTEADEAVTIAVLANDSDADGDALTVAAVTEAANGTVMINPDGTITYTPDGDFFGSDSFGYTIADGNGGAASAIVTINVTEDQCGVTINGGAADELLVGSDCGDRLIGSRGDDTLDGAGGNDRLDGGDGFDVMIGGEGDDTLAAGINADSLEGGAGDNRLRGEEGRDTIVGGDGNDRLEGGDDKDALSGGAGEDTLIGGEGRDTLTGGADADRFRFDKLDDFSGEDQFADRIMDFSQAEGDQIDLRKLDAITGGGDDAFAFIGNAAFSGAAGELRYEAESSTITYVEGDIDGDGAADFTIRLESGVALMAADFLF